MRLLVVLLGLLSAACAWESCTDLRFGAIGEEACLAVTLHAGVATAQGHFGARVLGPVRWDLAELATDFRVAPSVEGCMSAGLPGAEVCLRVEGLAIRLGPAEARGLDGCFFVSGRLLKRVLITQPLGCVNLTSGGASDEL
jgi:hypothetical protein